jgi:hypothetical protein
MRSKFDIGDKIRFSNRCPDYVKQEYMSRTRTIIDKLYDPDKKCCYYELGGRGKGRMGYLLRSYMLKPVTEEERHRIGRPRTTINNAKAEISQVGGVLVPCYT